MRRTSSSTGEAGVGGWSLTPVTFQCVAQGVLERAQPRLVVLPLIEPFAINGLAHLLRACGADAALGAVELETRRLEGQFAELEDPPDAALEIVDHVLVVDAQHPARQHRVP